MLRRPRVPEPAAGPGPGTPADARPLLVTCDVEVADEVVRLAALAGVDLEVAPDPTSSPAAWRRAPLVLLGPDVPPASRAARREGVVALGSDADDAGVWRRAVALGAAEVVVLPEGGARVVSLLGEAVHRPRPRRVLGVVGGRGGAGASVLATALAVTAARRSGPVLLVDADPGGGGLDLLLGAEAVGGVRWPDVASVPPAPAAGPAGPERDPRVTSPLRGEAAALLSLAPLAHGVHVLSCARVGPDPSWSHGPASPDPAGAPSPAALAALLDGALAHPLVVVDLPRDGGPLARAALARCTDTLLLVPARVRAVAAAGAVRDRVAQEGSAPALVVRAAGRGLQPAAVGAALGLPVTAVLPPERGLDDALDRGEAPARSGRGPLAVTCAELLDGLPDRGAGA